MSKKSFRKSELEMPIGGWIIVSVIGLAITIVYLLIIGFIFSYEQAGVFVADLFTSAIASGFAVILYCKKVPNNVPVILIIYGSLVFYTIIQFVVRYIQNSN